MGYFSRWRTHADKLIVSPGQQAEQLACDYLQRHGLRIKTRNFRVRGGEIDIVACEEDNVLFVEVRYRRSQQFGGALASIDIRKQQRIMHAAQCYLQQYPALENLPCRFDVVVLSGVLTAPRIDWLKNAFP